MQNIYHRNNYRKEPITKIEGKKEVSGIRSITTGFNQGIAHMYANPVEREAMEDAKLIKAEIDENRKEARRLLAGLFKDL